ncbi:unnamed protein product [Cylindrotheca closterium]|uniref:Uncharacterized protein n=1 Tax=Cylindrotheca closterium TaxID=2856 RepID=A0AAD2GC74_9STRA|nr:unnamed protein product [Cylindrotheca closterium]
MGATVPATVPAIVPGASASTSGASSVAGSINTPLRLAGTTGNQMKQVPTQGCCTVTVPYSMNANGEIAFSGMQLGHQRFSGAQVRQGFDATQAKTPQIVKTGYYDMSEMSSTMLSRKRMRMAMMSSLFHVLLVQQMLNFKPTGTMLVKMKVCLILLLKQIKELNMHTNPGSRVLDKEGFLGRFPPPVYHNEDGIANVLAMREMIAAGYRAGRLLDCYISILYFLFNTCIIQITEHG